MKEISWRLATALLVGVVFFGCGSGSDGDTSPTTDIADASIPDTAMPDTAADTAIPDTPTDTTTPDTAPTDTPAETGTDSGTVDTSPDDEGLPEDAVEDLFVEDNPLPDQGVADTDHPDIQPDEGQADVVELPCSGVGPLEWSGDMNQSMNWATAVTACENLGEGWRMPDICEMRSAIVGCPATQAPGECGISYECDDFCDGDCNGCQLGAGPGTNGCYLPAEWPGPCGYYWTSTPHGSWAGKAWMINAERAFPFAADKTGKANVRCVK